MVSTPLLRSLAGKYIWWKTPDESLRFPQRVIAQVMNIGDYEDVQAMSDDQTEARLKQALLEAEAGQFSPKSWSYWHYRLGLARPGEVPALPIRRFENDPSVRP
jgi:hypothetical protein